MTRSKWARFGLVYIYENLFNIGFERSIIFRWVFYRDNLVFLVYVDVIIFFSLDGKSIENTIKELVGSKLKL